MEKRLTTTYIRGEAILIDEQLMPAVVEIQKGKITKIHRGSSTLKYAAYPSQIIDAGNNIVMPGLIDTHTHVDEPGRTDWEGYSTATRAGAAGGFTSIIDMPLQCNPPTTTEQNFDCKLYAAQGKCQIDVGFWGGAIPGNHTDMKHLLERGVCGFKCFLISTGFDEFPLTREADLDMHLELIDGTGSVLMCHCEVEEEGSVMPTENVESYETLLESRPPSMEYKAVEMLARVMKRHKGVRCHIVHLSATETLPIIKDLKQQGYPLTVETCPHYLHFSNEDIGVGCSEYLALPPIRTADNREVLWSALDEGLIDMIAADHANCTPDRKPRDFILSWGGIAGLQFGLPVVWTNAHKRGFSVIDVWRWMSLGPAKLASVDKEKAHIKEGYDADFVIWNSRKEFQIETDEIYYKNKLTPYHGMSFLGQVLKTIVRGEIVFNEGVFSKPQGKFLLRKWGPIKDISYSDSYRPIPQVIGGGWHSRRSPVYSTNGMVACTQPLAVEIGLSILKKGGNAADACVGMAAALNLVQPNSTGIGGDVFVQYWNAKERKKHGLNATGRCPGALSLETFRDLGFSERNRPNILDPLWITVPGAAAGWIDTHKMFGSGKLSMGEILADVIALAENGYPVGLVTAQAWLLSEQKLQRHNAHELLLKGKTPCAGEIMRNPGLAKTFRLLAEKGKRGFYEGEVAESIVQSARAFGGVISLMDLKNHTNSTPEPIRIVYRTWEMFEMPPNSEGIGFLIALNILEGYDLNKMEHNSPEYLHHVIEALRVGFADAHYYVADPDNAPAPLHELLSKKYANSRRKLISHNQANRTNIVHGYPERSSHTAYFCSVDKEGNACSFVNSNYVDFGSQIVAEGYGFTLTNRGHCFSLDPTHPNCLAPNKRPYNTVTPGMAFKDGELWGPFGVMGGCNQQQGNLQVILNIVDFAMNVQEALDAPRVQIYGGSGLIDGDDRAGQILLEHPISGDVRQKLEDMGHKSPKIVKRWERQTFGSGQIIHRNTLSGVLSGGSDPRNDGMALGY